MLLHYLVKRGCSKFLPNTGFITIRLLRFGVRVKRAYCRKNFLLLPNMRRLSGDHFFLFQQNSAPAHREHNTVAFLERERDTRNALDSKCLCPCTGTTHRARILTILSPLPAVMTANNSAK